MGIGDGAAPSRLIAADFSGDGWPDLATANVGSDNATVLVGVSTGGFADPVSVSLGDAAGPAAIAALDANGDGRTDLVAANRSSNNVSVVLNDIAGGLTPAATIPLGGLVDPIDVAAGDVNGDGYVDLAVPIHSQDEVVLLYGNESGRFDPPIRQAIDGGQGPSSASLGDFDGDGRVDLLTTNEATSDVTVLLNMMPGYEQPVSYRTNIADTPQAITHGDVDGDQRPDLIVANSRSDDLAVFPGLADGRFGDPNIVPITGAQHPSDVVAADINGDERLDLITSNRHSDNVAIPMGSW